MNKMKKILSIFIVLSMIIPNCSANAAKTKQTTKKIEEEKVTYNSVTTFSDDTTEKNKTYKSKNAKENALLVTNGTSTITSATVSKNGDDDTLELYGINSAIFVTDNGNLTINDSKINTSGIGANAIYVSGNGNTSINNSTIETSKDNSVGIMVSDKGNIKVNNCNVTTKSKSSAAIKSNKIGGRIIVNGGNYTTNGIDSPVVYSMGDIEVNESILTSTKSDGLIVEGSSSITLDNTKINNTNTTPNEDGTNRNIYLYQKTKDDKSVSTFKAKNSIIITNKGDTFFVTNTKAVIELENNEIINSNGEFLRIQKSTIDAEKTNGGNVTLNLSNQKILGNIIIDEDSILDLSLKSGSTFIGTINGENKAKEVNLTLSTNSILALTADTYVSSLTNAINDNSNIYSNGYKLFVGGTEVKINESKYGLDENENTKKDELEEDDEETKKGNSKYIIGAVLIGGVIICIAYIIIKRKQDMFPKYQEDDIEE